MDLISGIRDKIYEVLDLAKIVHNMESEESDLTVVERKELMKNAESIKETRSSITTISQHVDEANTKLMLINEKIQALKVQQEEQEQLVSSGLELLSLAPSIEDLDKSLADILEKLGTLGGGDNDLQPSSSLAEARANLERGKAQL